MRERAVIYEQPKLTEPFCFNFQKKFPQFAIAKCAIDIWQLAARVRNNFVYILAFY